MIKRLFLSLLLVSFCLFFVNCFNFDIQHDIDYPKSAFHNQQNLINNLNKSKKPVNLSLMFYEGDDRQLIKLSIPVSLIESAGYDEIQNMEKYSKDYLNNLDAADLKKLLTMGQGLIIEVKDKIENNHLLLWME